MDESRRRPVVRGMTMEQVRAILGPPDEERPTSFGSERLTVWVYGTGTKQGFVWFDQSGKVKMIDLGTG